MSLAAPFVSASDGLVPSIEGRVVLLAVDAMVVVQEYWEMEMLLRVGAYAGLLPRMNLHRCNKRGQVKDTKGVFHHEDNESRFLAVEPVWAGKAIACSESHQYKVPFPGNSHWIWHN